jgi:DNA-binding NarL/FixJ family response regulator
MTIRILLVDDHTLVRAGFRSLLEGVNDLQIVAEANNGYDAIEQVRKYHPDLVLMDIAMPGINGLETTERIRREFPNVRVVLLSMYTNEEYVLQAVRIGAAGYVVKDADASEFELAIRSVAAGGAYLSPAVSRHVMNGYARTITGDEEANGTQLSPRQREVLRLIASGYTTKEIATQLGITLKTVDAHRSQLMRELNIHNVAGLVRYAVRTGLINPNE